MISLTKSLQPLPEPTTGKILLLCVWYGKDKILPAMVFITSDEEWVDSTEGDFTLDQWISDNNCPMDQIYWQLLDEPKP
jgi:hypothetical protein